MEDYWLRPIRFYESERRNFSEHYSVKVVYLSGYSKNQTVAFWLFSPGSLDNMSKQSSQVFLPFRWQELS